MTSLALTPDRTTLEPTPAELREVLRFKHGDPERAGWGVRLRAHHGYATPDEYYEAVVMRLAPAAGRWADVGCGRDVFPHNRALAADLVGRCGYVVGVDCDATIAENRLVHQRVRARVEEFRSDQPFDLVTLRMVAEHIADPPAAVAALSRVTKPGGAVVVYTINRWSPVSLLAWLIPFRFHHAVKRCLWGTEEKDTFPVVYRMNTRPALARLFRAAGFRERFFTKLDDCRTFSRFRLLHRLELTAWRFLRAIGLHYPENCLLGVYVRDPAGGPTRA